MGFSTWIRQILGFLASRYWKKIEMFADKEGPIESFTWGKFIIFGKQHSGGNPQVGAGKDIRIIGTEVTPWTDRSGHLLSRRMITGVFDRGIEVLILGLGANRAVECPRSVVEEIRQSGIPELILLDTPAACRRFNELYREGKRVAFLAHGTC
ncbi:hypothetical protein AUK22_09900 [bacterium CG2_30_54_10]|nr:MAG: hypothetical protein AUK22_09900 [bacterium CG2_30_54_10]